MTRALLELFAWASVPALLAWIATGLLRRGPASLRHLAWAAGLAGMAAVTLLRPALPKLDVAVLRTPQVASADAPAAHSEGSEKKQRAPATTPAPTEHAAEPAVDATRTRPWTASLPTLLVATWLGGALLLLAQLLLGLLRAARLARTAEPLPDDDPWRRDLARIAPAVAPVRVLVSAAVHGPVAIGAPRAIVLPRAARGWPAATRRPVLLHELAHLERRDWLAQILARLVVAVHWPHPLAWHAARRLVAEAEMACDDHVLLSGAPDDDYAQRLLELTHAARGERSGRSGRLLAVAMARRGQLSGRIESILDPTLRRHVMQRKQLLLATVALLPLIALLVTLEPVRAAAPTAPTFILEEAVDGELILAAARGDLDRVRRLLREGVDPDTEVPRFGTALIVAAANGELATVRALLEAGADPGHAVRGDLVEGLQRTALTTAARHGHLAIAELLLEAGAPPDAVVPGDGTALIEASRHGHDQVVELLLAWGADATRQVSGDGDALTGAVAGGHPDTAERLLRAGAEADQWTDGDESPFFHAVAGGNRKLVERLLDQGADPDARWPGDGSPLIVAARHGALEVVDALLRRGADPNQGVRGDGSPLIAAAGAGHLEIARRLVDAGAEVDLVVPGDENPLIQAAAAGELEVASFLVDAGADVNARVVVHGEWLPGGSEVRTPLGMALRHGHREMAELLRSVGARP
ncbi:MAG TPA: ankyrin repeat domain-containing protein [Thermoanaerobaculia bacterium]|nr:ankyrin repeat domain-containing protein [Thermoanaerobaculia bacterium]